ncbi:MAG: amidohydrolase family protein [Planctomycetes bacterium]|nr:amidohydrolase family protein [Planctomycetota bacterium]
MNLPKKLIFVPIFTIASIAAVSRPAIAMQEHVVVKGGRIIPVSGPEIENGTILIENGKIVAVGRTVDTPYDAKIIDATGKVVIPGYVDAHFTRGYDRANESYPFTPYISVADSLDGVSQDFEDALRDGVTTINVIHGNAQPIAGRGMIVRPFGRIVEDMAVVYDGALKMSFIPRQFASHVSQFAELRRVFDELKDYMERLSDRHEDDQEREKTKKEEEKKQAEKDGKKPEVKNDKPVTPKDAREEEDVDRRRRTLVDLTKGRIPVFAAVNAAEVPFALDFARKHGFFERLTLVVGADAWKVADLIAASGRPVVLDPELIHKEKDPVTGKDIETPVAPVFAKKGVRFALTTTRSEYTQRYLNTQAATTVRTGVDRETALKSITQFPAEILGLGDRVGSIEKGRDANVLILSGDPLATTTFVEKVVVEGKLVYERENDERLKRIINVTEKSAKRMSTPDSKPASAPESKPESKPADEHKDDKENKDNKEKKDGDK